MEKAVKWKTRKEAYGDALEYMKGRRSGAIKSFHTPWNSFDDAGIAGWEYNSVVLVCGRPGNFKTTIKDLIFNKAVENNPGEEFNILDFQFEMLARVTALREFATKTKKSYKDLCSAKSLVELDVMQKCVDYANDRVTKSVNDIFTVEDACTILEFRDIVVDFMEKNKKSNGEYVNTLIGIDHTRLFNKAPFESSEEEMISNLGKMLTFLKRKYPILFIVLSQLNRDIERPERNEDGKSSNYPTPSDIFGSDGIYQHTDLCIILNRPSIKNIRHYGPNRFVIISDGILPAHIIKARNGDVRLSFLEADGATMNIYEIEPPGMQIAKSKPLPASLLENSGKKPEDNKTPELFQNNNFLQQTTSTDDDLPF